MCKVYIGTSSDQEEGGRLYRLLTNWLRKQRIRYKKATGWWKGASEASVIAEVDNAVVFEKVLRYAFGVLGQDAVLVDVNGKGFLYDKNGGITTAGHLLGEEEVKRLFDGGMPEAFTVVGGKTLVYA